MEFRGGGGVEWSGGERHESSELCVYVFVYMSANEHFSRRGGGWEGTLFFIVCRRKILQNIFPAV